MYDNISNIAIVILILIVIISCGIYFVIINSFIVIIITSIQVGKYWLSFYKINIFS